MTTRKTPVKLPVTQLEKLIRHTLDERKAEDIISVDLVGKADFADSMIIASGTSTRHVSALGEHVIKTLKDAGMESVPVEGLEAGDWVLVDAGDVIVHIFRPEARALFNLEKMWSVPAPAAKKSPLVRDLSPA